MKKLISGIVAVAMALSLAACEKETKVISLVVKQWEQLIMLNTLMKAQ